MTDLTLNTTEGDENHYHRFTDTGSRVQTLGRHLGASSPEKPTAEKRFCP